MTTPVEECQHRAEGVLCHWKKTWKRKRQRKLQVCALLLSPNASGSRAWLVLRPLLHPCLLVPSRGTWEARWEKQEIFGEKQRGGFIQEPAPPEKGPGAEAPRGPDVSSTQRPKGNVPEYGPSERPMHGIRSLHPPQIAQRQRSRVVTAINGIGAGNRRLADGEGEWPDTWTCPQKPPRKRENQTATP